MRRTMFGFMAAAAVTLYLTTPAAAAPRPGSLDPAFGAGGLVRTDYFGNFDEVREIVLQPDGKFVIGGEATRTLAGGSDDRDFQATRYNPDGSLDATFGVGGKAAIDMGTDFDVAFDAALAPDGKVVLAGVAGDEMALLRYNANGTIDTTFGNRGKVVTRFPGNRIGAMTTVTVQPDGKVVAGGDTSPADVDDSAFSLLRLTRSGVPDPTFGQGGFVVTNFVPDYDAVSADGIVVRPDGKIVVGGTVTLPGTGQDFAVARYNPNGKLDTSFGYGGLSHIDFAGADDEGDSVALQADGKIVMSGVMNTGQDPVTNQEVGDFGLTRFTEDGRLDTSFGNGGTVSTSFPRSASSSLDQAFDVAIQRDGKIVAVGGAGFDRPDICDNPDGVCADDSDLALARYTASGRLDPTFGNGGRVTTNVTADDDDPDSYENLFGVAIQPDGRIVTGGRIQSAPVHNDRDIIIARYLP